MNLGDTVWWRHTANYLRIGTVTEVGNQQTAVKVDTETIHVSKDILLPVEDIPTGRWRGIPDTVYHRRRDSAHREPSCWCRRHVPRNTKPTATTRHRVTPCST